MTILTLADILGLITILVSFIGFVFGVHRVVQFFKLKGELSDRLAGVFLSDSLIYLVTVLFGLMTFLGKDADIILYPVRIIFICLNIYFGYRLTRPLE